MPNLCYWCGRLTHHDRDCSLWLKRNGTWRKGDQQFCFWLPVNTPNLAKKSIIQVTGYEEEVGGDIETNSSPKRGGAVEHVRMGISSDSIGGDGQ